MERQESRLFAPYKALGGVCSAVSPAFRTLPTKRRITSILCALGNVVVQYSAERLRLVSVSDILPANIQYVAADKRYVYAAVGSRIAVLHMSRQVKLWIDAENNVKLMIPFGEFLVIVDDQNSIGVFEVETGKRILQIDFSNEFEISAINHPATYLNKTLIGSSRGNLRLVNVKTGKLIHQFETTFNGAVMVLEQAPAIDVIGVGLSSGQIVLHNIKYDRTIAIYKQESAVTAIAFRSDGEESMVSAAANGSITIWDLCEKKLIGQLPEAHNDCVTGLSFFVNEPLMVSSGADNVLKTWIFDMGDGMPRQLILLEGHSKPVSAIKFCGTDCVLSAGLDGSLRLFSVKRDTQRQKLGNAGIMTRAKAKKIGRDLDSIALDVIEDLVLGYSREAAWDNIVCRHKETALVTTWTSRNQCLGKHRLLHKRFYTDPLLVSAIATSIFLTACGNYTVIGYSSGHIDCFNIQSGKHRKTFVACAEKETAHASSVRGVAVDTLNKIMVSAEEAGIVRFWGFSSCKLLSELQVPFPVVRFSMSVRNSLLAIGVGDGSVGIVDILCRRVVRIIKKAHNSAFTVLEFSPDSKWLVTADVEGLMKVWDLITNNLIDVMKCKSPCISASFSPAGEYLATVHHEQRLVYLWANKVQFSTNVDMIALPHDYDPVTHSVLPVLNMDENAQNASTEVDKLEDHLPDHLQSSELIVFSGLATSRWANLPDLDIIRERNKPTEPPQKPKAAPFFLASIPTLEGFEFEKIEVDETREERKALMAKRSMLEIETTFTRSLLQAKTDVEYLNVFDSLKAMNVSSVDFHIRSLPARGLPHFLKMLLIVAKNRRNFELVQAYLSTCLKIHGNVLWAKTMGPEPDEMDEILTNLHDEIKLAWNSLDALIKENTSIIRWINSALL